MAKMGKSVLYRVETKRDAKMIKDFVLFTYRQRFPKVTRNFLIVGLLSLVFIYGGKIRAVQIICLFIGVFCILMAFFRHHIPIFNMKRRDPDFLEQNTLSYEFTSTGFTGYRNDEPYIKVNDYHKIHHVYHDEEYYYIGFNEQDLIILPKKKFTDGDPVEFEQFIQRKSGIEPSWVPVDRNARKEVRKKERAAKMARAEEMQKQRAAEVAQQRAEMREAFEKAKEARKAKRESEQK